MSCRRKHPPHSLTDDERRELTQVSHSRTAPAARVARAVRILAVADDSDYQQTARAAGRRSGDAVSHLVARLDREGSTALDPRHGGLPDKYLPPNGEVRAGFMECSGHLSFDPEVGARGDRQVQDARVRRLLDQGPKREDNMS
jgi:hypothetical protein